MRGVSKNQEGSIRRRKWRKGADHELISYANEEASTPRTCSLNVYVCRYIALFTTTRTLSPWVIFHYYSPPSLHYLRTPSFRLEEEPRDDRPTVECLHLAMIIIFIVRDNTLIESSNRAHEGLDSTQAALGQIHSLSIWWAILVPPIKLSSPNYCHGIFDRRSPKSYSNGQ